MSVREETERRLAADEERLRRGAALLEQLRKVLDLVREKLPKTAIALRLGMSRKTLYTRLGALRLRNSRRFSPLKKRCRRGNK